MPLLIVLIIDYFANSLNLISMEQELSRNCVFEQDYKITQQKADPIVGDYTILRHKTNNDSVLCTSAILTTKDSVLSTISSFANRKELNHPNLMALREFSVRENDGLCWSTYTVKAFYEYSDNTMKSYAKNYTKEDGTLPTSILTKLLYNMVCQS